MKGDNVPSKNEKVTAILILLLGIVIIILGIYFVYDHFFDKSQEKSEDFEVQTIDLESDEGKEIIRKIEEKYGDEIYFLKETKVIDFSTLSKVEKICLGINEPDITVTIDEENYPGYTEKQILDNLKNKFNKDITIDPLEKMGDTLIFQELCPSSALTYNPEQASYYLSPLELKEPLPDVISKITRIEKQDGKLVVYGSAIFRDSNGIVYKDLEDKTKITDFKLKDDNTFEDLSSDQETFEYYLQNSYQYIFTFTNDDNLYWISYERSEQ